MWIILIIFLLMFGLLYNQLIREKNQINNAFSTVSVLLKKRYDLIPNLVETVKAYSSHEQSLYENITILRSKAMQTRDKDEAIILDNNISNEINKLLAVSESYPTLKATENYLKLQKVLKELEDELSAARRTYNAAVTEYNISLESFPTNIIAKLFNMKKHELFLIEQMERSNVQIDI